MKLVPFYISKYINSREFVLLTLFALNIGCKRDVLTPTFNCGTSIVSDVDGNNYNTIQIGNQCWFQSNLKVSKYLNGDSIPTGLSNSDWGNIAIGAISIYNNEPLNDSIFGKLYNHYTITDGRGLCPTGWHIPSDGEWNNLVKFLDQTADTACVPCIQSSTAGGALKSKLSQPAIGGWVTSPFSGSTNITGFSALAGGVRNVNGTYEHVHRASMIWSKDVFENVAARGRILQFEAGTLLRGSNPRKAGFSVRCLKD